MSKSVNIVGAGPSGLFCAYILIKNGFSVELFDQMSGVAKKFLVAGNGGLNLTHSEELEKFSSRYFENSERFAKLISEFSPTDLRSWCEELGVETFIGSSGRVFPKKLKAADMLSRWLKILKKSDRFNLNLKHKLIDCSKEGELLFETPEGQKKLSSEIAILGLGGGSWKKTGSDGLWVNYLKNLDLDINEFSSMNCGFTIDWSSKFKEGFEDEHLKNIKVFFEDREVAGEVMLTGYGIEGGAIYAHSSYIQRCLNKGEESTIYIDLKPQLSVSEILEKLKKPRKKNSLSNHLRKVLNLSKISIVLLREVLSKDEFNSMDTLAGTIKSLPLKLLEARPIDEAISTRGGVKFVNVNDDLLVKDTNEIYLIGEMLDWEAPTGGYLLQGCFSMAYHVSNRIVAKNS